MNRRFLSKGQVLSALMIVGLFALAARLDAKQPVSVKVVNDKVCCEVVRSVLPQMSALHVIDSVWIKAVDAKGKLVGYLLNSTKYGVDNIGRNGPVPVLIVLSSSKKVLKVQVVNSSEGPSYLSKIQKIGFYDQWKGKTLSEVKSMKVDAVSGATLTSDAVAANVRLMAKKADPR